MYIKINISVNLKKKKSKKHVKTFLYIGREVELHQKSNFNHFIA